MKKLEKTLTAILVLLECITLQLISEFATPYILITMLILIIVIDIILANIDS